jgi:hypothetical protein
MISKMAEATSFVVADFRRQRLFFLILLVVAVLVAMMLSGLNGPVYRLVEAVFVSLAIVELFLYWRGKRLDVFLALEGDTI